MRRRRWMPSGSNGKEQKENVDRSLYNRNWTFTINQGTFSVMEVLVFILNALNRISETIYHTEYFDFLREHLSIDSHCMGSKLFQFRTEVRAANSNCIPWMLLEPFCSSFLRDNTGRWRTYFSCTNRRALKILPVVILWAAGCTWNKKWRRMRRSNR